MAKILKIRSMREAVECGLVRMMKAYDGRFDYEVVRFDILGTTNGMEWNKRLLVNIKGEFDYETSEKALIALNKARISLNKAIRRYKFRAIIAPPRLSGYVKRMV